MVWFLSVLTRLIHGRIRMSTDEQDIRCVDIRVHTVTDRVVSGINLCTIRRHLHSYTDDPGLTRSRDVGGYTDPPGLRIHGTNTVDFRTG
jgi:hypothetical protein